MKHAQELRRFFQILEKRFGGVPLDTGAAAEVIVSDRLERHHLERLLKHQATAIHVPNYYKEPAKLAQTLTQEAKSNANNWKVSTNRGLESSDVFTLGKHPPYNVAVAQRTTDEYFEKVQIELEDRRKHNALWPLDQLRLNLDEAWPGGAGLARDPVTKRPFSGGLPRIMQGPTRWKHGYIHVDDMNILNPNHGLFSGNIYLQVPDGGADLSIWPTAIRSRWDWYRNATLLSGLSVSDPAAQVRLRLELGHAQRIRVGGGDLVLFCVQRPHAAMGFEEGTRVSLQCFIQHQGLDQRLLIDS